MISRFYYIVYYGIKIVVDNLLGAGKNWIIFAEMGRFHSKLLGPIQNQALMYIRHSIMYE